LFKYNIKYNVRHGKQMVPALLYSKIPR